MAGPAPHTGNTEGAAHDAITVVLADDHDLVRHALRLVLDGEADMRVVGEARDLSTALDAVMDQAPDVLLLDLGMPGGSSLGAIRSAREHVPHTEIVVVTMQDSAPFARAALGAGAVGYVLKDDADLELGEAVRRAARGQGFVSPALAGTVDGHGHDAPAPSAAR